MMAEGTNLTKVHLQKKVAHLLKLMEQSQDSARIVLNQPKVQKVFRQELKLDAEEENDLKEYIINLFEMNSQHNQLNQLSKARINREMTPSGGNHSRSQAKFKFKTNRLNDSFDSELSRNDSKEEKSAEAQHSEAAMMILKIGMASEAQDEHSERIFKTVNTQINSLRLFMRMLKLSKSVSILIPPTILIQADSKECVVLYNEGPHNKLKIKIFTTTKEKILKNVQKYLVPKSDQQSKEDFFFPKFIMKLNYKIDEGNMRLVFSMDYLQRELRMNQGHIDIMIQQYIRPKGNKTHVVRYCLKDQNIVYKALILQKLNQYDHQSNQLYKQMRQLVQEQRRKQTHDKIKEREKEQNQHQKQPWMMTPIERRTSTKTLLETIVQQELGLKVNPERRKSNFFDISTLKGNKTFQSNRGQSIDQKTDVYHDNEFELEKLYQMYTRQFSQDELSSQLVLSLKTFMKELEKNQKDQEKREQLFSSLYISQFRTCTFRQAQTASLDIAKFLTIKQAYVTRSKEPLKQIKRMLIDFMEGSDGRLYFLGVKGFYLSEDLETMRERSRSPTTAMESQMRRTQPTTIGVFPTLRTKEASACDKRCKHFHLSELHKTNSVPQDDDFFGQMSPKSPRKMTRGEQEDLSSSFMKKRRVFKEQCRGPVCSTEEHIMIHDFLQEFLYFSKEDIENADNILEPVKQITGDTISKYQKELKFGQSKLNKEGQIVSVMFPLVYSDFNKRFNTQDEKKLFGSDLVPVCLTCYYILVNFQKRNQSITFMSDGNKEELLKIQSRPFDQWTDENYRFVFSLYKGTREPLASSYQFFGGKARQELDYIKSAAGPLPPTTTVTTNASSRGFIKKSPSNRSLSSSARLKPLSTSKAKRKKPSQYSKIPAQTQQEEKPVTPVKLRPLAISPYKRSHSVLKVCNMMAAPLSLRQSPKQEVKPGFMRLKVVLDETS